MSSSLGPTQLRLMALEQQENYVKRTPLKNGVASTSRSPSTDTTEAKLIKQNTVGRRSFLKGLGMAGVASLPASTLLLSAGEAQTTTGRLGRGDAAILRFLAVAEILETDLWLQYW